MQCLKIGERVGVERIMRIERAEKGKPMGCGCGLYL